ncbi:hypothetical protein [Halobacteriovorax marinus]|nr:hypothetical protein [Halobacteriovorax marinus]
MSYILTIVSSSNPITDVFVVTMEGADFLKQGLNPYIQSYTDIFKGRYGYVAGYVYWPGVLLSLSPFKWIFGDVRYSYIFFQLLTLLILYRLSLKLGYSRLQAKSFPLLWSLFPVTFFVLEQTWTENLIILQLCILFFFLNLKKFSYAAIALGLLCATKQYNIFLAILSFFYVYKNSSLLGAAKYTLIAITSSLLVFLPFLIWDYDSFLQTTLLDVLKYQPRGDSLSWYSWLFFHYKVKIPGYLTGIIYFTPTVLGAIYLMKKAHSSITDLLFFIVINYCIVFLFGKQAFCNYYYLIAFMILLYSIFRFKDFLGTQNFKSDSTDISGL